MTTAAQAAAVSADGLTLYVLTTTTTGESDAADTVTFTAYKLNATATATTANLSVATTASGTDAQAVTQELTANSVVISPVTADAIDDVGDTNKAVGTTTTFTWTVQNSTQASDFGGQRVNFAKNVTVGSLNRTYGITASDGTVAVNFTAPSTANIVIRINATINGTSVKDDVNVTITGAAASKLHIYPDVSKVAPTETATITVTAQDIYGNNETASIHNILLATTTPGATITGFGAGTNPDAMTAGVVKFTLSKTSAGDVALTATDLSAGPLTYATGTQKFTEPITSIELVPSATTVVANGSVVNLTASVKGAAGNVIAVSGQAIAITSSNATLATIGTAAPPTNASGFATSNVTANAAGLTGTVYVNASYTNATGVKLWSNQSIDVVLGTPSNATSTFTAPAAVVAGADGNFSALIRDSTSTVLGDVPVRFTIDTLGGTLSNATTSGTEVYVTTSSTGYANVTLTTNATIGVNTVRARTLTGDVNQTDSVTTTNGTAAKLVYTATTPASMPISGTTLIEVELQDANGNAVPQSGLRVNFTSSVPALGYFTPIYRLTDATGKANSTFKANATGGSTVITAEAVGVTDATQTLNISNVASLLLTPAKLSLQTNETTIITVQTQDASGSNVSVAGVTLTFATDKGSTVNVTDNTVVKTTATTDANGMAQIGFNSTDQTTSVFTQGIATITAAGGGVAGSTQVTLVGSVADLIITASPTSTRINTNSTITAKFVDSDGQVVIPAGATISFGTTLGTLNNTGLVPLDASGNAVVNLTSSAAGTATVTALGEDKTNSTTVEFTITALTVTANVTSVELNTPTAVEFNVTSDGAAVGDALVSVSQAGVELVNGTTVLTGLVTLTVNATSTDTINVTATKTDHTEGTTTVTVGPAALLNMTVTATPATINASEATDITINVTDASTGAAIDGANVTLEFGGAATSPESTNTTLADGMCNITVNVTETGPINVTVTKAGYNAGSDTVTVSEAAVLTTITVTPATAALNESDTQAFTATPLDQNGDAITATVTWSSSNTTVGTINASTGAFAAVAAGTTTVTATSGSVTGTAAVNVYDSADTNHDCVVDMMELMTQIGNWKSGSVGMMELMTSIGRWKVGAGGYC